MAAVLFAALYRKVFPTVGHGVIISVGNILAVAFFDSASLHQLGPRLVAG